LSATTKKVHPKDRRWHRKHPPRSWAYI